MNKEFIPYEQALELKELGFDGECIAIYNRFKEIENSLFGNTEHDIDAPLYQQAFRWFREKGYLMSISRKFFRLDNSIEYNYFICPPDTNEPIEDNILDEYDTYEEAELACLKKLIEVVKTK